MYYSDLDDRDYEYPKDNYNFKRKKSKRKSSIYPEDMSNPDFISIDNDSSYDDEEYDRN